MITKRFIKYLAHASKIIMVLAAVSTVLFILQAVVLELIFTFFMPRPSEKPQRIDLQQQQDRIADSQKVFLPDGTIHLIHTSDEYARTSEEREIQIYDVNDNLLWSGKRKDRPYKYIFTFFDPQYPRSLRDYYLREQQMITPEFSRDLVIPVVSAERKIIQRWRYDPAGRYFVGFDAQGENIGYAGAEGLVASKDNIKPFGPFREMAAWSPKDAYSPILIWQTPNCLYQIDFAHRSVDLLFDSPEHQIKSIDLRYWTLPHNGELDYRPTLSLQTDDGSYHLVLRDPPQVISCKIPDSWYSLFMRVVATKENIFLKRLYMVGQPDPSNLELYRQWWENQRNQPFQRCIELYRIDGQGNLNFINRFEWTRHPRPKITAKTTAQQQYDKLRASIQNYVTSVSPPLFNLAWSCYYHRWYYPEVSRQSHTISHQIIAELILHFAPSNLKLSGILVLFLVGVGFVHARPRRTGWTRLIFWLVLIGAFNFVGFLTYLALNHSPLIRCRACNKRRGLQRPPCPHCGAALPEPALQNADRSLIIAAV